MSDSPSVNIYDVADVPESLIGSGETVLQTDAVEVTRVHMRADQQNPAYTPSDEVLLYCVSGAATVTCFNQQHELPAGSLLHLPAETPHALRGREDAVVLIINVARHDPRQTKAAAAAVEDEDIDQVQAASQDSFPASDPPSWTPVTSP